MEDCASSPRSPRSLCQSGSGSEAYMRPAPPPWQPHKARNGWSTTITSQGTPKTWSSKNFSSMIGPVAVRTPPPPVPERPATDWEGTEPSAAPKIEPMIPGKLSPQIVSPGMLTVSETSSGRQWRTRTQTWHPPGWQTMRQIPVILQRRQDPQLKNEACDSTKVPRISEKKTS